jgi:DNA topoisomerase-1
MGRFGPFVQIGTKDDADKPRFAGLRPGQKMDSISLAEALELFKLPRTLGVTENGETVITNVGRFGPYVKYGDKYVSLKEDDPYTVTLERALECIRAKQEADANRLIRHFETERIQILNGRYGPYITDGQKNARVPKDREPRSLTLEECQALLAAASARPARGRFGRRGATAKGAAATPAATAAAAGTASASAAGKARAKPSAGAARPRRSGSAHGSARDAAPGARSNGAAATNGATRPAAAGHGGGRRTLPGKPSRSASAAQARAAQPQAAAPRAARKAKKPAGARKLRGRAARTGTRTPPPKKVAGVS